MAISTLTPTLRACFTDNCTKIQIYDTTLAISTANPGGWGTANINAAAVDAASVAYTLPDGSVTTLNVTTAVNAQATVSGEFLIAEFTITPVDGVYTFSYTLIEGVDSVNKSITIFNLCSARCCVDKLWAKAAQNLVAGDCGCTSDKPSYTKTAMLAEATYNAIMKGVSCGDTVTRDALLLKLQRICKLENCNC
jgi:hypothetical protein